MVRASLPEIAFLERLLISGGVPSGPTCSGRPWPCEAGQWRPTVTVEPRPLAAKTQVADSGADAFPSRVAVGQDGALLTAWAQLSQRHTCQIRATSCGQPRSTTACRSRDASLSKVAPQPERRGRPRNRPRPPLQGSGQAFGRWIQQFGSGRCVAPCGPCVGQRTLEPAASSDRRRPEATPVVIPRRS